MYISYTEEIFHKTYITQADLVQYFQQARDETLFLEFKSFTEKINDHRERELRESEKEKGVIKTINAFLNSSGGLLIWGAPESVDIIRGKRKVKMCKGSLSPVSVFYDRDAFINKLASQIRPLPQGIRMQTVEVDSGYVYLFDVPESQNKPHMFDGRYYIRMDTSTHIAEHYFVHAMCRQIKNPELSIKVTLGKGKTSILDEYINFKVTLQIENIVEGINEYDVYVKAQTNNEGYITKFKGYENSTVLFEDVAKIISFGLPVEHDFVVSIKKQVHSEPGPIVKLWYGGRNSSVKSTSFKVDFINQTLYGQIVHYDMVYEFIDGL